jgi:glucosylceramidase
MGFIPYVQRAMKAAGRELLLEATMDYPPWWMLNTSTPLPSADLNSTYLEALANYYLKYVQALSENGINLEVLSLFNENPDSYIAASNENCQKLLVDYLGPLFKNYKGMPKLTWTEKFSRRITAEETPAFYEMEGVEEYTDVIFYHGYDCNYGPAEGLGWQCDGLNTTCPYLADASKTIRDFYEKYGKNRTLWMTEVCYASEFGDYNETKGCAKLPRLDFQDMTQWGDMLFADFNIVGANGWIYWNMILDMTGGPWLVSPEHNDPDPNPQQPVIVADPSTGRYYKTGVYYAMTHFGRFITPGSVRVGLDSSEDIPVTVSSTAFFDENSGTMVLVMMNKGSDAEIVNLEYGPSLKSSSAQLRLDPISISTFIFSVA